MVGSLVRVVADCCGFKRMSRDSSYYSDPGNRVALRRDEVGVLVERGPVWSLTLVPHRGGPVWIHADSLEVLLGADAGA